MNAAQLIDPGSGFWVALPLLVVLVAIAVAGAVIGPKIDRLIARREGDEQSWEGARHDATLMHVAALIIEDSLAAAALPVRERPAEDVVQLLRDIYWRTAETAEWLDINDQIAAVLRDNGGIFTPAADPGTVA